MASGGIKPPDVGTGGLHEHLKPVPVRLGPNGTYHGPHRPQNNQIKAKTYFKGVYFNLPTNNLVVRIEWGRLPLLSFLVKVSITTERLKA